MRDSALAKSASPILYAVRSRDRTQGFLRTGDFVGPEVENLRQRKARRLRERSARRPLAISIGEALA
jgi:hypothetical protein